MWPTEGHHVEDAYCVATRGAPLIMRQLEEEKGTQPNLEISFVCSGLKRQNSSNLYDRLNSWQRLSGVSELLRGPSPHGQEADPPRPPVADP